MHNACLCNELASLRNRVLMAVPEPDVAFVRTMRVFAHRVADWLGRGVTPMDGEWVDSYTGRKKTMYRNAELDLMFESFSKRDRYVKSFVKAEKVTDVSKDPRMIQARSPRYNYMLGNYLKPIEHRLYRLKGTRGLRRWLPGTRVIAKGMDSRTRAEIIASKMERFRSPVVVSIDASRFDAHVGRALLTVEHSIYLRYWRGDRMLQRLLNYQLVNRGWTSNGIRYKCPGGRMSGDMNTALGNCLIMTAMVAAMARHLQWQPGNWDMLCDGDDCLLFLDGSDHLDQIVATLARAGMTIKIEAKAYCLEDVEFCQSRPVWTADGLKMVRDVRKTLAGALTSNKWFREPRHIDAHLTRLGKCYMAISLGVPVLQEFAAAMLRNGRGKVARTMPMSGVMYKALAEYKAHMGKVEPVPVTDAARASFADAFGIGVAEQLVIERLLRELVL